MKNIFFSILFLSLLVGCHQGSQEKKIENVAKIQNIEVNLNSVDKLCVDDYFQYDSHIILETTNESLLANIGKIIFSNEKIYILDALQGKIFIFRNCLKIE